ncbi:flippase [Lacinutrix sp. MEBiC02595]
MNFKTVLKKKFEGEFAKKTLFSFLLKFFGLGLSYFFTLLISRFYGAEVVGRFSLTFTILNLFALFFALGIPDTMVKIIADSNYKQQFDLKKTALRAILISSVIGAIVLFLSAKPLALFYTDSVLYDYLLIAAAALVPLVLLRYNFEILRGRNEIVKFGFLSHIIPYLISVLAILFVFFVFEEKNGLQTIKVYFLGTVIAFILSIFLTKHKEEIKRKAFPLKKMMNYSLPMLATSSFIFLMGWTDTLMLGYYNDKADVGIYSVVIKIARIAIIVLTSVNLVLAPKISELYSKSEHDKMKELIRKATKIIFITTAPMVGLILIANKFVLGLFGDEFIIGSTALIVIMLAQLFNAMTGSVGQVMNMTGNHKKLRDFTIISVILNIVLNLILIPLYGILGAAIATATSSVVINIISVIFVKRRLGIITYISPFNSK